MEESTKKTASITSGQITLENNDVRFDGEKMQRNKIDYK